MEEFWNSAKPTHETFDPTKLGVLPVGARQYLQHAICAGTPLATAVRFRMHGEIKLKGWSAFEAEEVINWDQGFIWQAKMTMRGLHIRGEDTVTHGKGAMRWKLLGVVPLVNASGPDITRSAAGRMNVESLRLPSVLAYRHVSWGEREPLHPRASFSAHGETADLN